VQKQGSCSVSDVPELDKLTAETFAPYVGSAFMISQPCRETLTLRSAQSLSNSRIQSEQRPPFSLLFIGSVGRKLPQQIYTLQHQSLGEMEIFLVPIRETGDERHYEAIFT
jgi:hypothetical protein